MPLVWVYATLPPSVSFSRTVVLALSDPIMFLTDEFGTMPVSSSRVSERRAPEFSPDAATLALFETERPLRKKSRTLFGCAIQGCALPLYWSQPLVWS